jgi:hypothetical protein
LARGWPHKIKLDHAFHVGLLGIPLRDSMVRAVGERAATFTSATRGHETRTREISSTNNLFQSPSFHPDQIEFHRMPPCHEPHELHGYWKNPFQQSSTAARNLLPKVGALACTQLQSFLFVPPSWRRHRLFGPLVSLAICNFGKVVFATTDFLAGGSPFEVRIEIPVGITSPGEQSIVVSISAYSGRQNQRHPIIQSPRMQSHVHTHERVL